jgi:hypothetical protein
MVILIPPSVNPPAQEALPHNEICIHKVEEILFDCQESPRSLCIRAKQAELAAVASAPPEEWEWAAALAY